MVVGIAGKQESTKALIVLNSALILTKSNLEKL